jgi:hypothetical protein
MKKEVDQIPDLLFHMAQGFYDIAINCAYNVSKDTDITGFQRIAPGAVNMTFTAELLLKGLILLIEKKYPKGHSLKSLFEELSEIVRKQIEKMYKDYYEKDRHNKDLGAFKIVVAKENKEKDKKPHADNDTLEQLLTTHDKGFENWRYLHEINHEGYTYEIDFNSLNCFIKAVVDTINSQPNRQRLFLSKMT